MLEDVGKLADIPLGGAGAARVGHPHPAGASSSSNGELALQDRVPRASRSGTVSSAVTVRDRCLSFPDATGMKGRTAYQGRAVLDFRGDSTQVHVAANIPNGRVEDLIEVLAPVSPAVQSLRRVVLGGARGAMTLEGPSGDAWRAGSTSTSPR